jgi:hypothetical protein
MAGEMSALDPGGSRADSPVVPPPTSERFAPTPLELEGWVEWNVWRSGLSVLRYAEEAGASSLGAILYVDRRGRVKLPAGNPYLAVVYRAAPSRPSSHTGAWHTLAAPLVSEMKGRGSANQLHLPPEIRDVRPWAWDGFMVGVRYTYYLDFPVNVGRIEGGTRRHGDKALRLGMTVERVTDVRPVTECLAETAARQHFALFPGQHELDAARRLLGDEHLRMYVCFDRQGRAASCCVVLHAPGARAIEWLAGTAGHGLAEGAAPLLHRVVFDDLAQAGAAGIDLCGANNPSVAAFKSRWGSQLTPNYTVRTHSVRAAARFVADWLHSAKT